MFNDCFFYFKCHILHTSVNSWQFISFEVWFSEIYDNKYLFKDIITLEFYHVFAALLHEIHVALDVRFSKILRISPNRIITKMNKLISNLFSIIIRSWKSYITFIINPNRQWIKVCGNNPLSYIKFPTLNNKRILYILLSNPLWLFCFHMILNLN